MAKSESTTKPVKVLQPVEVERFQELVRKTRKAKPRPKDVDALRSYLESHPQLWCVIGDVAKLAYNKLTDNIAGEHVGLRESLTIGREAMRAELGYQQATPLERLLIDQVLLCWLRLYGIEFSYTATLEKNVPLALADYWERKLSAAQRRYLRACETLARIHKLRLPSVQINIADKQVNVADGQ